jgi:hypothetical protein
VTAWRGSLGAILLNSDSPILRKSPAAVDALGEVLFGTPNGSAGDPTPVKHLSDPDRLAVLKAELQEKLLLRRV